MNPLHRIFHYIVFIEITTSLIVSIYSRPAETDCNGNKQCMTESDKYRLTRFTVVIHRYCCSIDNYTTSKTIVKS
jgi:hypothetical protein